MNPVGVHIESASPGYSRDSALACARQMGATVAVVLNDPALCAMLLQAGIQPIYRVKDAAFDDDNGHQHNFSAQAYAQRLQSDLAAYGATAAWRYGLNEVGNQDLPRLKAWMLDYITALDHFNATGVLFNLAWRNWNMSDHDFMAEVYARMKGKHKAGVHEGIGPGQSTVAQELGQGIGRFLPMQSKYGVEVICTEWAISLDAYHSVNDAVRVEQVVAQVYAPHNTPICLFTTFPWHDFGYLHDEAYKQQIASINTRYKLVTPPTPSVQIPAALGDPLVATVNATAGLRRHVAPSVTAPVLTPAIVYKTLVTEYPSTAVPEGTNTFVHIHDAAGNPAWVAMQYLTPVDAPAETNRIVIDKMPYANQFGWGTNYTALCGETSLLMLLEYDRLLKHVALPPEITPLSIAHYLGKGPKDFTSLQELDKAGSAYGLGLHLDLDTGLWSDPLELFKTEIDAQRPVIALLDYSQLPTRHDQKFTGNHILVVCGVSDQSIICHDPDDNGVAGAFVSYPRADFLAAWQAMGTLALILD